MFNDDDFFSNNNNRNSGGGGLGIFSSIVEKANRTTNSETAKKIRSGLIRFGAIGLGVGILLIIIAIITLLSSMMSMDFDGPSQGSIIGGFVMFFIGGIVMGLGSSALNAGVKISLVGVGADILDTTKKCPNCGDPVAQDEAFCDKCGTPLYNATLCSCGKQNEIDSAFCKACGQRLR